MKFIALYLSIIVLALTVTPCCALEGNEGHAHEIKQKEKHECSEQDDDCCKDCSPFYVCGSCLGFTLNTQGDITFTIALKRVEHITAYVPALLPLIRFAVWQPPKLC